VNLGLSWSGEGYEQNPEDWEAIQRSGASLYRLQIDKGLVDRHGCQLCVVAFHLAWERKVTILPFLYGWTNGSQIFPVQSEYGAWKVWVERVVGRFGAGGTFWQGRADPLPPTAWEIWNEPNFAPNNPGGVKIQPENYARFLKESASGVWSAQPAPSPDGDGLACQAIRIRRGGVRTATLLTNSFEMIKAHSAAWNISTLLWYFYRDTNGESWPAHCGLRAKDGRFRPSWLAYQAQTMSSSTIQR